MKYSYHFHGKLNKKQQSWLERYYPGLLLNEAIERKLRSLDSDLENDDSQYEIKDVHTSDKSIQIEGEILKIKEAFRKPRDRKKVIKIPPKDKNPFRNRYRDENK